MTLLLQLLPLMALPLLSPPGARPLPVTLLLLLLLPLLLNVLLRAEHLEAFLYESFGGLELFVVLDLVELTTNQQKY